MNDNFYWWEEFHKIAKEQQKEETIKLNKWLDKKAKEFVK